MTNKIKILVQDTELSKHALSLSTWWLTLNTCILSKEAKYNTRQRNMLFIAWVFDEDCSI